MTTLQLHGLDLSGHSHRAKLFLSLLGLEAEMIQVDLLNGAHKQREFLAKNLFGQVPVLEDGETVIADSNAILVYLAQKYDHSGNWYPKDPQTAAEIQRFLSVAAGPVANGPASARLVNVFNAQLDHERAINIAHAMLSVLNQHLEGRKWLVGDHPTIADIANYSYIAHAPEGDVSLEAYPQVRNWLARIEQLPGFVAMPSTAVGLAS
ncbi:glutathione S-transferase family protein [Pontibacterium sp.]|uniref:glutathione S-transferase family protein n=1 Tax=Pontibacterium sp. TaxID=2036026 RepID=UPI003514FB29